VVLLSGCQISPEYQPYELSQYTEEDSLEFFRAELARVAPELDRPNVRKLHAGWGTDHRSRKILRSQEFLATLEEETDFHWEKKRIPFVKIHGKPTGTKGEMEITISTGYGRWLPEPPSTGDVTTGGFIGPIDGPDGQKNMIPGTTLRWTELSEKPYTRKVIRLR
jgi:hypothetical protein